MVPFFTDFARQMGEERIMKLRRSRRFLSLLLAAAMALSTFALALEENDGTPDAPAQEDLISTETDEPETAPASIDTPEALLPTALETAKAAYEGRSRDGAADGRLTLPEKGTYLEGELLVKLERRPTLYSADDPIAAYAAEVDYLFSVDSDSGSGIAFFSSEPQADWFRLTLREDVDMLEAWTALARDASVAAVQPNYIYQGQSVTGGSLREDPLRYTQTWLERIHAPEAWEALSGAQPGENVVVAVVDSGVQPDHPDLRGQLLPGYDFVDNDNDPADEVGHGTHVAGIIAAARNDIGVRGVAYGAKLLPVRVLDGTNRGSSLNIANGILWAAGLTPVDEDGNPLTDVPANGNRANVINLSLGGSFYDQMEDDAIRQAREAGCLVVAAAGNDSVSTGSVPQPNGSYTCSVTYSPANLDGVLTVMAADPDGGLAGFSNYDSDPGSGVEYEILAPGADILSTGIGSSYILMSGTSMAAPVVSGAAAVLMGLGCNADSAFQIISSCQKTKVEKNGVPYDYSTLDLAACVETARESKNTYHTAPNVSGNLSMLASLPNLTFNDEAGEVNLSGLDTPYRVYYRSGELLSALYLGVRNIGGAGQILVSGTVGGTAVYGEASIGLGGSMDIPLSLKGTPAVADGRVYYELTVSTPEDNGTPAAISGSFSAYELRTPDESDALIFKADSYSYYCLSDGLTEATLNGSSQMGVVWVMDADIGVSADQTLNIYPAQSDFNVLVYQGANCSLQMLSEEIDGATHWSTANLLGLELRAADAFKILGVGSMNLRYCSIIDPYIAWADSIKNCEFQNIAFSKPAISAYTVDGCGFYWLYNLKMDCFYFSRNLVTNCINTALTVEREAWHNTFIENYVDSEDAPGILTVYAPNYQVSEADDRSIVCGFHRSSVIGPMQMLNKDSGAPALVYEVYYQPADVQHIADSLTCAEGSAVSTSIDDLAQWGFAGDSPAFITGVEGRYANELAPDGTVAYYEARVHFSTPVTGAPRPVSYSDDCSDGAAVKLSEDGSLATLRGSSYFWGTNMEHYFTVEDIYTRSSGEDHFDCTALWGQSAGRFPIGFDYREDDLGLSISSISTSDNGNCTIEWTQSSGGTLTILRSVNDGPYESIAEFPVASDESGSYLDTDSFPGNTVLHYQLRLTNEAARTEQHKTGTILISAPEQEKKLLLNEMTDGSISVSFSDKTIASNMVFIFPGVTAEAVLFGDGVKDSGLIFSAVQEDDGLKIVLGVDSAAILPENTPLFTLVSPKGDLRRVEMATEDGAVRWQIKYSSAVTVEGIGSYLLLEDGTLSLRCDDGMTGTAYLARYDAQSGQLLALTALDAGTHNISAQSGATLKVFFLNAAHEPIANAITLENA